MSGPTRRGFLAASSAVTLTASLPVSAMAPTSNKLGIDVFSLRSQNWTPFQVIDYCAQQGAQVVHLSEVRFIGSLEDAHIRALREHADRKNVQLELGMRSICPSSKSFDAKQGTAEEQLTRMINASRLAGSPIVRCFLGSMDDRKGAQPIAVHIENTAKVIRAVRTRLQDANIKVAVENHAGDMQARELKTLIDEAGKDVAGVCLDAGNPMWVLEDPHLTLETLAPYALTSHVRDSAVWRVPEGAAVAWTRLGEGNVEIDRWVKRYRELCPGKNILLEIIVTRPRTFAYLTPAFWEGYQTVRAHEFARFVAWAEKGQARDIPAVPKEQALERERADLEASMAYLKQLVS